VSEHGESSRSDLRLPRQPEHRVRRIDHEVFVCHLVLITRGLADAAIVESQYHEAGACERVGPHEERTVTAHRLVAVLLP
jgi:hypothetical protein